jgi:8-oxo-dGTP diphosphatase
MPERPRPVLAVGAVVVRDDELLLIRRGHGPAGGYWAVPGGKVEFGETVHEAVVRELLEETGLHGVADRVIGHAELITEVDHYFVVDLGVTVLDEAEPTAGSDAAEVRWVPTREVGDYRLVEGLAEFLHDNGIIDLLV